MKHIMIGHNCGYESVALYVCALDSSKYNMLLGSLSGCKIVHTFFGARAEAYNWFKAEYNIDKLSQTEKTLAWQRYAIKLITEKAEKLEINQKQAKRDQLRARIENMKVEYGSDLI